MKLISVSKSVTLLIRKMQPSLGVGLSLKQNTEYNEEIKFDTEYIQTTAVNIIRIDLSLEVILMQSINTVDRTNHNESERILQTNPLIKYLI